MYTFTFQNFRPQRKYTAVDGYATQQQNHEGCPFCGKGVKVAAKNYLEDVVEPVVKPLNTTLFKGQKWTMQQDSAPAHKAKVVQAWLKNNTPDIISTSE